MAWWASHGCADFVKSKAACETAGEAPGVDLPCQGSAERHTIRMRSGLFEA